MQTLFETLGNILAPDYSVMELAAIQVSPAINTPNGKQYRWVVGDKCKVENGELCDFKNHNEATSIITSVRRDLYNIVLEMSVMDLKTHQLQTIKIK